MTLTLPTRCPDVTEQPHGQASPWPLFASLGTIVVVFIGLGLAALSLWFAPAVGLLLVAFGLSGSKVGLPRPLAVVVLVLGVLLLLISVAAFWPVPDPQPTRFSDVAAFALLLPSHSSA